MKKEGWRSIGKRTRRNSKKRKNRRGRAREGEKRDLEREEPKEKVVTVILH